MAEPRMPLIESLEGIVEDMRAILVQQGDDSEILREARTALSDWFVATYPHLYPGHGRPQLKVIKGTGTGIVMQYQARYTADRYCGECSRMAAVEVVVQDPAMIGYRCDRGHKWLAGKLTAVKGRRPVPVLAGKTGGPVADDDEDRPPWE